MNDIRHDKLADIIVNYSLKLQAGEKVLIRGNGYVTEPLVRALLRAAKAAGALPIYRMDSNALTREWLKDADSEMIKLAAMADEYQMKQMDAFVGITAPENALELSDLPETVMRDYEKFYIEPVHMKLRVPHTRWTVLRYPTQALAQSAGMSSEGFEDWYFRVCLIDYARMGEVLAPLKSLMEKTKHVRILGPGETDLSFSIKDIPVIPCSGRANIPDGEIYTAPVKNSVNGIIAYNTSSIYSGFQFTDIRFRFEQGRIVEASANDTKRINAVLNIDEGARYVGEFALGVNPHITYPINNTLFDEKIRGSLHFTPGNSYDHASNGNKSILHWDIVLLQEKQHGGGEIYFDDVLIRKDGRFVLKELEGLNPENLG
ncbi:MAG: aminopeptidase [Spirochaeta sp. LUC14_002_19_P3]|nr:MAG: aminopeptidase [Spirochaeta sp. LUC14_002_19_P3]